MLNLHQINVFLEAAETLNFTRAAQRLEMTQPSVSQHIQALEQHFGIDLFIRSGRSLELTEAGFTLAQLAREMRFLSNHIEEKMASVQGDVYGHLFVGCSTTTGRYLLPRLLAEFHREFPQVRATCQVVSPNQAAQMLCDGKVHLALTSVPELCKEAELCKFLTDTIYLVAPLNHPIASKAKIAPQELYENEFILPEENTETFVAVQEAIYQIGISIYQLKPLMILGSPEAIGLAVKEGVGIGFVSNVIYQKIIKDQVKVIPVRGLNIHQDIFIGRSTNRACTQAQEAFWEFVIKKKDSIQEEFNAEQLSLLELS